MIAPLPAATGSSVNVPIVVNPTPAARGPHAAAPKPTDHLRSSSAGCFTFRAAAFHFSSGVSLVLGAGALGPLACELLTIRSELAVTVSVPSHELKTLFTWYRCE
jgi:hypothetical protein